MPGSYIECDEAMMEHFGITLYPGYKTTFTRQQSPLAKIKNGARVRKLWEDAPGDIHAVGELGTVLGSIGHPAVGVGYFVEWDDLPRMPTCVVESKLEQVE
jgi:hypothetical protein